MRSACALGSSCSVAGRGRRGWARRVEQRAHARDKLSDLERLRQVVVAAGAETGEPVGQRVARGQEDHRRHHAVRTQRLADVAPVGVGQADVEHQQVGRLRAEALDRFVPGHRRVDREVFGLESAREDRPQLAVVLADPDSRDCHIPMMVDRERVRSRRSGCVQVW